MKKAILNKIIDNRILFSSYLVYIFWGCTGCGTTLKIKMQFEESNSGYLEFTQNTEPAYLNDNFISEQSKIFSKAGFELKINRKDSFIFITRLNFNNFGDELKHLIAGFDGNDSFRVNIFGTSDNYERTGLNIIPSPVKHGFFWDSQEIYLVVCQDKHIGRWHHWSGKAEIIMPFEDTNFDIIEETEKNIPSKIHLEIPYKNTLFIYFDDDAGINQSDAKKWFTIRIKSSKFNLDWKETLGVVATFLAIIATIIGFFKRKSKE